MRFHPAYQLRQHAAGRFLLRQLEGETWLLLIAFAVDPVAKWQTNE
jgi:hypothetical protein